MPDVESRRRAMDEEAWTRINRERWDERVPIHLKSDFYRLTLIRQGHDSLLPFEPGELADVRGKELIHLQCHIGVDTVSWARHGARVTGLDFSEAAIRAARSLAKDCGIPEAKFAVGNTYEALDKLANTAGYDIVYTGKGSINWLPDLDRWAHVVTSLLRPGGLFYMTEFHPVANILDEATCRYPIDDYFMHGPIEYSLPGTYASLNAKTVHNRGVEWRHTLGDVVSSLAGAGLVIEFLRERPVTTFAHFADALTPDSAGVWRFPEGIPRLPLTYSLRARRPVD